MKIVVTDLRDIFNKILIKLREEESFISGLDRNIGDGDHGANIARGFTEVSKIDSSELTISSYLSQAGTKLMATVGGASGPLYGMSFIGGANTIKEYENLNWEAFKKFVEGFIANLKRLGRASVGEKTMVDVWVPFYEKISTIDTLTEESKKELVSFLDELVEKTKDMIATKGRSSYLKERSQGFVDPGSYSSAIILKAFLGE